MKLKTYSVFILLLYGSSIAAQNDSSEKLKRDLVAVQVPGGVFLSWRFLAGDAPDVSFNLYRDGEKVNENPYSTVTNAIDEKGGTDSHYTVEVLQARKPTGEVYGPVSVWSSPYLTIATDRPADEQTGHGTYGYTPNDCSTGDVDGDGEYEIILKWDPTNSQDNSRSGFTGNVYLDAYKMNGRKLWRIDLGQNIRAGAHYTQFMVYDLDGDGKAEVACKTAPGTIDGTGRFVLLPGDSTHADYRNRSGHILRGPEYLTVFSGENGRALSTVPYTPNRDVHPSGESDDRRNSWGDNHGNRSERYLACVAFLDGKRPSLVMCRGYYTFSHLTAYLFDGKELTMQWSYNSPFWQEAYGQGAHGISVGDVDGDGCDEIVYGSAVIDHDGTCLYSTGLGHGDALHLCDIDPDSEGLEIFMPQESRPYGFNLRRAATGEMLYRETGNEDNGRGIAADIDGRYRGHEFWSANSRNLYSCTGEIISKQRPASMNFRIYWDGDLQDELLDGSRIDKWDGEKAVKLVDFTDFTAARSCNGTKKTPNLTADLLGDWREEVVLWDAETGDLLLFTTVIPSDYRVVTPMQDHIYRMGIVWQNTAYNQPPHLGYWLPDRVQKR